MINRKVTRILEDGEHEIVVKPYKPNIRSASNRYTLILKRAGLDKPHEKGDWKTIECSAINKEDPNELQVIYKKGADKFSQYFKKAEWEIHKVYDKNDEFHEERKERKRIQETIKKARKARRGEMMAGAEEKVSAYLREHPNAGQREVAKAIGIPDSRWLIGLMCKLQGKGPFKKHGPALKPEVPKSPEPAINLVEEDPDKDLEATPKTTPEVVANPRAEAPGQYYARNHLNETRFESIEDLANMQASIAAEATRQEMLRKYKLAQHGRELMAKADTMGVGSFIPER